MITMRTIFNHLTRRHQGMVGTALRAVLAHGEFTNVSAAIAHTSDGSESRPYHQRLRFSVCLCICLLGLAACKRDQITDANLGALKPMMTTKEVESILGTPVKVQTGPELVTREVKTLPVTRYVYEKDGKEVSLTFVGDRLAEDANKGVPVEKKYKK